LIARKTGPDWNQIIWVKEGKGLFFVGDESFTLSEGEGIFMRHNIPHSYRAIGDKFCTGWVTFESDDALINYSLGNRAAFPFKCPGFLERETAQLLKYAKSEDTDELRLSAALYGYLAELFSAITKNTDEIIDRVRTFLIKNYHRPLTLDEIADAVEMDKYSLCRYFAKHHTCSVMDELKYIRVSRAKQLLRYSSDSVEDIGHKCGFDSPSYFSLRFREITGRSPLEYRKQYR
jgi:AraC-like DNA-binding protein